MASEELKQAALGLRAQVIEMIGAAAPAITGEQIMIPTRAGDREALIYRPEAEGLRPALIDIHGGGFVFGGPADGDAFNREICDTLGMVVIAPSYRLAPEHSYPAAHEDVFDAVKYVYDNAEEFGIDRDRIALLGDSAGGTLLEAMCLQAIETGAFEIALAVAVYPAVDYMTPLDAKDYPQGSLPIEVFQICYGTYVDGADGSDIHLSSINAPAEMLAKMPPHVVITDEGDALREEGEELAKRLMAAGVQVTGRRFYGVGHGFLTAGFAPPISDPETADKALQEAKQLILDNLRALL